MKPIPWPALGPRRWSMALACDEWQRRDGRSIVETGCVRQADDWDGAGMSTLVFGDAIGRRGFGHLWTVDNNAGHLQTARGLSAPYAAWTTYVLEDSVAFLQRWRGRIDLLYLDSLDYPYGALLDLYGGREDLPSAITTLGALGDAEVVRRHGDLIAEAQEHCRRELEAALPHLATGALVLIDDAQLPGGGKARLARGVLASAGFRLLADGYQTLWTRDVVATPTSPWDAVL